MRMNIVSCIPLHYWRSMADFVDEFKCTFKITVLVIEKKIYIKRFLIFLQESFQRLLHKQDGTRAEWEYPFAVAGINISFMLAQMLDLQSGNMNFSNDNCTPLITQNRYTEKCSNCNECC